MGANQHLMEIQVTHRDSLLVHYSTIIMNLIKWYFSRPDNSDPVNDDLLPMQWGCARKELRSEVRYTQLKHLQNQSV